MCVIDFNSCSQGKTGSAQEVVLQLWQHGYSASDIIGTIFKVCRVHDMPEPTKLEFLRIIGFSHMRIAEGMATLTQLLGCIAQLSKFGQQQQQQA